MKMVHCESSKLYESVKKYSKSETAEKIAFGADLSPSPTRTEREKWLKYVSSSLEEEFDTQTIMAIRMACFCHEDGKLEESKKFIRGVYDSSRSLEDFVENMNKHNVGWYLEDGYLFTKYFSCSCPMLEGIDHLETKTWCYCTAGYNKEIFENVFQCEVDVELLESIKIGHEQCLMKIKPKF